MAEEKKSHEKLGRNLEGPQKGQWTSSKPKIDVRDRKIEGKKE